MATEERKALRLDMTIKDMILEMSEGNPGAINIMMSVATSREGLDSMLFLMNLDDMNIRGSQIYIGFKDYCLYTMQAEERELAKKGKRDPEPIDAKAHLERFVKCVKDRSKAMVNKINEEGRLGNHPHVAVTSGGSFTNGRKTFAGS